MIDLLVNHWDSVLVVVVFLGFVFFLLKRGANKKVRKMLFYLVSEAETIFGSGTGELKYAAVVTWIYERLPLILKFLFTEKQIDSMIEDAVQEMKDYLGNNEVARVMIMGGNEQWLE